MQLPDFEARPAGPPADTGPQPDEVRRAFAVVGADGKYEDLAWEGELEPEEEDEP